LSLEDSLKKAKTEQHAKDKFADSLLKEAELHSCIEHFQCNCVDNITVSSLEFRTELLHVFR